MRLQLHIILLFFPVVMFSQSLTIISPTEGSELHPFGNVNLSIDVQGFNVADGTGDGHIHWTIQEDADSPEAQDMKYDTNMEIFEVSEGSSYTVYMELVDNNHTPIIPAVNATVNFTVATFIVLEFSDFTGLRASVVSNGSGYYAFAQINVFRVTHTDYATNRFWMEDPDTSNDPNISGMLIYDEFGVFQNLHNRKDILLVEEFGFRIETNNGLMHLIPLSVLTTTLLTEEPESPQLVTISDFIANHEDYESVLIELQDVTFDDGDGATSFLVDTDYDVTDGDLNSVNKRTDFSNADYIGQLIPSAQIPSLLAIGGENNGTPEIYVRSISDMTLGNEDLELANDFLVYPNPVKSEFRIKSNTDSRKSMAIINMLGKTVYNRLIQNNESIDISHLSSGVYFLKIEEGNKFTTQKLVKD